MGFTISLAGISACIAKTGCRLPAIDHLLGRVVIIETLVVG